MSESKLVRVCATMGRPLSQCNAWQEISCEPSKYEPKMESGVERCSKCGLLRTFIRECKAGGAK